MTATDRAAKLLGCEWDGLLDCSLYDAIVEAERRCTNLYVELSTPAIAAIIAAWEMTHDSLPVMRD